MFFVKLFLKHLKFFPTRYGLKQKKNPLPISGLVQSDNILSKVNISWNELNTKDFFIVELYFVFHQKKKMYTKKKSVFVLRSRQYSDLQKTESIGHYP